MKNIIAAFASASTRSTGWRRRPRRRPRRKLAALKVGVGYPDKWRDYSALEVVRGDAFGNVERAELVRVPATTLDKLGKPVDRGEWVMTPQTVNAVNLPALNALNFPARDPAAAVLRPDAAPAAVNYGAHRRGHRPRDQPQLRRQGRAVRRRRPAAQLVDARRTSRTSRRRAAQLAAQYDAYKPFPDLHVNGKQTLSENIADVAGLAAAYDAYRASLDGKEAPAVDGPHRRPAVLPRLRAELARLQARAEALRQQS